MSEHRGSRRSSSSPSYATVHLVRHGEVYNPDKVLYGRIPGFGLSTLGQEMAQGIAQYFAHRQESGRPVSLLVSSPLQRAQETIAPLAQALNMPVREEPRVIEAENRFEGLSGVKRQLRKPGYWPLLRNPLQPSWGEPYTDQVSRMLAAVRDLAEEACSIAGQGAEIVVVSHQLPIWVTRRWVQGQRLFHDPRKRQCSLTSITSLHIGDSGVQSLTYREPNKKLSQQATALPGA